MLPTASDRVNHEQLSCLEDIARPRAGPHALRVISTEVGPPPNLIDLPLICRRQQKERAMPEIRPDQRGMRVAWARDGELAALAAAWQGAVGRDRPRGAAGKHLRPRLADGDRRGLPAASCADLARTSAPNWRTAAASCCCTPGDPALEMAAVWRMYECARRCRSASGCGSGSRLPALRPN
jgi:hypothetical protein